MKRTRFLLVLFGLLDAMLLGRSLDSVRFAVTPCPPELWWLQALYVVRPWFLMSLAVTAVGLAMARRWAIVVSYVQFPFRIAYVYLSFAFLTRITCALFGRDAYTPTMWGAIGLEGLRLMATIWLHVVLVRAARQARPAGQSVGK